MAALAENDRLTGPFLASAGQVSFDADFPLVDAPGDAAGACVLLVRERGNVQDSLTLPAFSVSNPKDDGFTLTLAAPALAGDRYWIVGRQKQARLRSHPLGGAVRTPVLEGDALEAAAKQQEAARDLNRAILLPVGESGLVLPTSPERGGRMMAFDTAGGLTLIDAVAVLATVGVFVDDGAWGDGQDPLTHDDGPFA